MIALCDLRRVLCARMRRSIGVRSGTLTGGVRLRGCKNGGLSCASSPPPRSPCSGSSSFAAGELFLVFNVAPTPPCRFRTVGHSCLFPYRWPPTSIGTRKPKRLIAAPSFAMYCFRCFLSGRAAGLTWPIPLGHIGIPRFYVRRGLFQPQPLIGSHFSQRPLRSGAELRGGGWSCPTVLKAWR